MSAAGPSRPTTAGSAASPGRRAQVLRALKQAAEPLDIATLADQLAVHPNTVRFHLEALQRTGQVEQASTAARGRGRPAARYRATPGMDPTGPTQYRTLARILAADIASDARPRERAIEAGRKWGAGLVTGGRRDVPEPAGDHAARSRAVPAAEELDVLVEVLEELDFDPEPDPPGYPGTLGLRHCPFLDLVAEYPGTICAIHLGLMQGVMQARGSDTEVHDLVPFGEPDLCVAHLRSRTQ